MKKIALLLIVLALMCSSLIACGGHKYAEDWSHDEVYHWHACTDEGCTEVQDKNAHSWGTEAGTDDKGNQTHTCTVCSATYIVSAEVSFVARCYANSTPTKIVGNTVQQFGDRRLKGYYELITDTIGGKEAARYYTKYDKMRTVEEGATEVVVGAIETVEQTMEYLEGKGVRYDGAGSWVNEGSFAPLKGAIAVNLDGSLLKNISFENNTLSFIVPADATETVLGIAVDSAVSVTIVTDGEVVLAIDMLYSLPAKDNVQETSVSIEVDYSYDNEQLEIK